VLGGIVTLFISANRRNKEHLCKGVQVSVNGGEKNHVTKAEVLKTIEKTAKGSLVKKHFGEINLTLLERSLEANPWVRDAELFFDTKDVLNVAVQERVPVARVFTRGGASFYIDSAGYTMPLSENYGEKLPVVTGFTAAKKWSAKDSATLRGIKNIIAFVVPQPFWNAQIGQIDITPDGKFELVPTVGSHIIKLGYGDDVEEKLNKLLVFYKKVLPNAGLAKYSALDIQFSGQVVAVKKGPGSPVDSVQLQKNIQELMRKKATEQEAEVTWKEDSLPIAIVPVITISTDSLKSAVKKTAVTIKKKEKNTTADKRQGKQAAKKPKAVLQKRG
jgi:cell division protein FtsQ